MAATADEGSVYYTTVTAGNGVVVSKVKDGWFDEEPETGADPDVSYFSGWEIITERFDPQTGSRVSLSRTIYKWNDDGEYVNETYDHEGKKVSSSFYRSKTKNLYNEDDEQIGSVTEEFDAEGRVTERRVREEQYDARGLYLGNKSVTTTFAKNGSVKSVSESNYDSISGETREVTTNAKGTVLYRSSSLTDHAGRYLYNEEMYSEHTGNLMRTVKVASRTEETGAYAYRKQELKATGQLASEENTSYMWVPQYGYLNYKSDYNRLLYRADGSLKYTIHGDHYIDNLYFGTFENTGDGGYHEEDPTPHRTTETTTAASGVLTKQSDFKRDLDSEDIYANYTKETKVYDEKTGALLSITTEESAKDPLTLKSTSTSRTVDPQGRLLAESTSGYADDVNGSYKDLGQDSASYLPDGKQTKHYAYSEDGTWYRRSRTYDINTGAVLIEETGNSLSNGYVSETSTYNADGKLQRKVITQYVQGEGNNSTITSNTYAANSTLLGSTVTSHEYYSDGSRRTRIDSTDAAGRETYNHWTTDVDADGNPSGVLHAIRSYYDAAGNLRVERTVDGITTVYDARSNVVSSTYVDDIGIARTVDADGKLLSYATIDDNGDTQEYFPSGAVKTKVARDDDNEVRTTSYDGEGYINYVSIRHPERPYTMVYDGNGKVAEIYYWDGGGREAIYDASKKQWYAGDGDNKVAIPVPDFAAGIDMSDIETGGKAKPAPRGSWYLNNTSCAFGVSLRDVKPSLTSKWYTVTPIDVSRDGVQSFELVGGNMWIIGQVNVTVKGDEVVVDYDIILDGKGRTKVKGEYLNIFADIDSITEEALEGKGENGEGYKFGEPISIAQDLGGDTNVVLYVRNLVDYNTRVYGNRFLVRMWPNIPERKERRNAMIDMMDPITLDEAAAPAK